MRVAVDCAVHQAVGAGQHAEVVVKVVGWPIEKDEQAAV